MTTRVTAPDFVLSMAESCALSREGLEGYVGIDVLWAIWDDEDGATHARVVRGRNLNGPDLSHAAEAVYDENGAYDLQERLGDPMTVAADGTWEDVLPPVPTQFRHLVDGAPAAA